MNKKFMSMIALTAMSSMIGVNAFGDSGIDQKSYLISGTPIEQIDHSYKNLKIDSTKTTYVIYMDSNISLKHTSGISWVDGSQFSSIVLEGDCLNEYDMSTLFVSGDGCFNQFSSTTSEFDEKQSGNFLILESK